MEVGHPEDFEVPDGLLNVTKQRRKLLGKIRWLTQKRKKYPNFHKEKFGKILVMCSRLKKEVGLGFFLAVKWCTSTECQRRMQKKTGDFCVAETSVSHSSASSCSETLISTPCKLQSCAVHPEHLPHILVFLSWDRDCGHRPYPQRQDKVFIGEQSNKEAESWGTFCWDILTVGQPLEKLKGLVPAKLGFL